MWGRTIMFPQLDENYNRTIFSSVDPGFEKQLPQVFYLHNVMPTVLGYQSIGYEQLTGAATTDFEVVLDHAFQIQTPDQLNFIYVPGGGKNFVFNGGGWIEAPWFPPGLITSTTITTTAFLHGQTYIYFANIGCYTYNHATNSLESVVLQGLDPTKIVSICAANGYMIAASEDAVAWSSIVDPTDFVPSLVTGAGGGSINDAKGPIVVALQITGGFIIYCQYNAVGATYSGNSSFPFIFLEVANSGGISTPEQVTYHSNRASHFMYGSYGLQELNKASAKGAYTEASDFLSAKLFEDFDELTNTFTSYYLQQQLAVKLVVIMGRYLVISYGINYLKYTHAIVYDMEFKRYGKLKIAHTDCFEWTDPHPSNPANPTASRVLPKKSIVFLQEKGQLQRVNFDFSEVGNHGVFLIGKFQFRRGTWITHQYGIVDCHVGGTPFRYQIWPTKNGRDFITPADGFYNAKLSGGRSALYQKLISGQNISILLTGGFNLSSLLFAFTTGSKR